MNAPQRNTTDLASFSNGWYRPGPAWKRILWMIVSALFFQHSLAGFSGLKCRLLRLFGARVGTGVVIKPCVAIKYPWFLRIGDHCWIGERVWIDNLAEVSIGSHVCVSQGAMLLTGNHDYRKSSFDLMIAPIALEDGSWVGAQSVVCPGVTLATHAILAVGSVATRRLDAYGIYQGNPAVRIRERVME